MPDDGCHVYLEIPGERVITGILRGAGRHAPDWVLPPYNLRQNNLMLVYVRLPNGRGLSAVLNETAYLTNGRTTPHGYRCYIPMSNNHVFVANLQPYYYEMHFLSSPRVIVRLPFLNHTLFTGMLQRR